MTVFTALGSAHRVWRSPVWKPWLLRAAPALALFLIACGDENSGKSADPAGSDEPGPEPEEQASKHARHFEKLEKNIATFKERVAKDGGRKESLMRIIARTSEKLPSSSSNSPSSKSLSQENSKLAFNVNEKLSEICTLWSTII